MVSPAPLPSPCRARVPPPPALVRSGRPLLTHGVAAGDVRPGSGLVWTRADRPSRMVVEVAGSPDFRRALRIPGPVLTPATDLTGKLRVPATRGRVHYRVVAEPLDGGPASAPLTGSFRAVPGRGEPVRIQWSGDVVGQGWGIDRATGGMRIFSAMADREPDLFLHSGDTVYADGPLTETVTLPDGRVWRNEMTEAKAKVAETLAEFRGQFAYNLRDDNLRRFAASVGQIVQWDDHEVTNNWYPGEILTGEVGERYTEKRVDVLAARGFRAFHEWQPVDPRTAVDGRVYRRVPFGPHIEVFVLDMRTYRSANSANTGRGERILGQAQARWLVDALASSRATWKIVASDMPIGVLVPDGDTAWEAVANGVPAAERARVGDRRGARRDPPAEGPQRRVGDRRRALHRRPPLRPRARRVHRLRPVLGVRVGPAARRGLRPERARPDVRPAGGVRARPVPAGREPAGGVPALRGARRRPGRRDPGGPPAGPGRRLPLDDHAPPDLTPAAGGPVTGGRPVPERWAGRAGAAGGAGRPEGRGRAGAVAVVARSLPCPGPRRPRGPAVAR